MESLLLSHSAFIPSQNKEVGYLGRKLQSSFYGNMVSNNFALRSNINSANRSVMISSVFGIGRKVKKVKKETVIPEPDYRIPIVLLGWSGGLIYADNLAAAVPIGLLGLLLLVQTTRVRFVFDDEALEVKVGEQLEESGENVFVGGKNRWKYSSFVNWELWWPNFPILVYFKETQTRPEGQVHFFPVIFNGKQLYDVMVERCGPSKTSAPKES
ncbi:OLC1v1037084C1 [Oldenlandia corymbosa var. corymbosa]|uniref:OLC1v1037084C1 n=1 Tax=Oldenlandia corymbosa var. corymbosa TaxID=529605 RepID=A0AAV1CWQ5_OLDCO|nr:OLC1v1037084C1 [Oldenlandia corymbosa var. corymbosa]